MNDSKPPPDFLYGLTFLALAAPMFAFITHGGIWPLLSWPGAAFQIVGISYLWGMPALFGKRQDGTRHELASLVLFPYLTLAHVVWSLQVWFSREPAWNRVNESLFVARRLRPHEFPADITYVCDLTCELSDPVQIRNSADYHCFPILDANTLPPHLLLTLIREFKLKQGERLLIHCANGHGRTGMVAAAWLIDNGFATSANDALDQLQAARPRIRLRRRQRQTLDDVERLIRGNSER